jgi:N-carbamoyl-L-amino-acid hydrolase
LNIKRFQQTLSEFNRYGANEKGITRLAYTKPHWELTQYFIKLCQEEGLEVRMDACGNVIGRRPGMENDLPAVACGSHLDTVCNGGKFDGVLGVAAGLEVIRSLNDQGITTKYPIEIIAFACEESSRFGVSTIGSKAMVGRLNKESIAELKDRDGITLRQAFAECSLEFDQIDEAVRRPEEMRAFFELHIEQGPILEKEGKSIGIVTGIAAPTRFHFEILGKASHSGTTPMYTRKDALLGAAELNLCLEKAALSESVNGTVATMGSCVVSPGVMNVIPEHVELKLEVRGVSVSSKAKVIGELFENIEQIQKRRGLRITSKLLSDEKPVLLQSEIVESLTKKCEEKGIPYKQMVSGAGHDAMNMAQLCPTGLIFLPSKDGLSHHPDEYTSLDDIVIGIELLKQEILYWAEII